MLFLFLFLHIEENISLIVVSTYLANWHASDGTKMWLKALVWFCHKAGGCSSNLPLIVNWYPDEHSVTVPSQGAFRCVRLSKSRKNGLMWFFKSSLKLYNLLYRKRKKDSYIMWCITLWHLKGAWKEICRTRICVATSVLKGITQMETGHWGKTVYEMLLMGSPWEDQEALVRVNLVEPWRSCCAYIMQLNLYSFRAFPYN